MILPTEAATSRPTVSTSSIGPIGMPNFSAALSITAPGIAFAETQDRFLHVRREDAIDQEARRAGDRHRQLVDRAAECGQPAFHLRRMKSCCDDLDQRHQRDRIEVMQAGEVGLFLQVCAKLRQRNRAVLVASSASGFIDSSSLA